MIYKRGETWWFEISARWAAEFESLPIAPAKSLLVNDAFTRSLRSRAHLRIARPLVDERITAAGNHAQPVGDRAVFVFQTLHRSGVIYIYGKETRVGACDRAPPMRGQAETGTSCNSEVEPDALKG